MAQAADNTVVLADHWEPGRDSVCTAVTLSNINVPITRRGGDGEQRAKIAAAGVRIIDAGP